MHPIYFSKRRPFILVFREVFSLLLLTMFIRVYRLNLTNCKLLLPIYSIRPLARYIQYKILYNAREELYIKGYI